MFCNGMRRCEILWSALLTEKRKQKVREMRLEQCNELLTLRDW
jgi:hypothetical protein